MALIICFSFHLLQTEMKQNTEEMIPQANLEHFNLNQFKQTVRNWLISLSQQFHNAPFYTFLKADFFFFNNQNLALENEKEIFLLFCFVFFFFWFQKLQVYFFPPP